MNIVDPADADTVQLARIKVRRKKQKPKRPYVLLVFLLLLFFTVVGSVLAAVGYEVYTPQYHRDLSLAQQGEQHLQKAESLLLTMQQNPFNDQVVSQTQQEFTAAETNFAQLNTSLNSLPGVSTSIPVYGTRLSTALHLASLALGISQAGVAGCKLVNILLTKLHGSLQTTQQGLLMSDMASIDQNFGQVKAGLQQAIEAANQVQPNNVQFDARLSKLFAGFRKEIPTIQAWLDTFGNLLPVLPSLLGIGTPANYLIEILDSTELRPAGGFIGNYGIATFSGGRLKTAHITDVVLLDVPYELAGHVIPYPATYSWFSHYLAKGSWSFRDSGLDADFPTAARYGELTYKQEGGNIPVQGVIAITPALIQHALAITGPIYVPEYNETVTAQNLIARIHFHQLGGTAAGEGSSLIPSPDGHSSLRKRFTELLAEHFLARVQQLPSSASARLLQLMMSSVRAKDIQIYLNASSAESALQLLHLDGSIQSPVGDHLFIVDANVAGDKANEFILDTVQDQVTIDEKGNAIHHTTISYAWTLPGPIYGRSVYQDYVRVYVPVSSVLTTQSGWQPQGKSTAFGCQVWVGFFTLTYGQTRTITLVWTSPQAAKKGATSWDYQYLIQRQAGVQRMLNLQVMLPSNAVVASRQGGLVPQGQQGAKLIQSSTQDLNIGVNYVLN
jgi:Protein of unknown function (DUF4012)